MKRLLNLLVLLTFLAIGMPQEAQASCCSVDNTSCSVETNQGQHSPLKPCGKKCCDCNCCGSISFLLKKEAIIIDKKTEYHPLIFQYKSFYDALFSASIWQPPRLG